MRGYTASYLERKKSLLVLHHQELYILIYLARVIGKIRADQLICVVKIYPNIYLKVGFINV
jgi:hypothetical protein